MGGVGQRGGTLRVGPGRQLYMHILQHGACDGQVGFPTVPHEPNNLGGVNGKQGGSGNGRYRQCAPLQCSGMPPFPPNAHTQGLCPRTVSIKGPGTRRCRRAESTPLSHASTARLGVPALPPAPPAPPAPPPVAPLAPPPAPPTIPGASPRTSSVDSSPSTAGCSTQAVSSKSVGATGALGTAGEGAEAGAGAEAEADVTSAAPPSTGTGAPSKGGRSASGTLGGTGPAPLAPAPTPAPAPAEGPGAGAAAGTTGEATGAACEAPATGRPASNRSVTWDPAAKAALITPPSAKLDMKELVGGGRVGRTDGCTVEKGGRRGRRARTGKGKHAIVANARARPTWRPQPHNPTTPRTLPPPPPTHTP
jgi:hypothetical protein